MNAIAINESPAIPSVTRRVYTVDEIQDILGIGRTTAYALVKRNLFQSVKVGHKVLISRKSFDEWLEQS
jgi:excisionase family DNA binding protein